MKTPKFNKDGTPRTTASEALRKAARRAGWNRETGEPVNPVQERIAEANKAKGFGDA